MATIKLIYNRRNQLNNKRLASIDFQIIINRSVAFIGSKIAISPEHWDGKKGKIKPNHPNHYEYNAFLEEKIKTVNEYFFECIKLDQEPSLAKTKSLISTKKANGNDFLQFMEDQAQSRSDIQSSTRIHYFTEINKLRAWSNNVSFSDINLDWIHGYNNHLKKQGLKPNTIWKSHKTIKTFINAAIKLELMAKNPYDNFKIAKEQVNREVLSLEEVRNFYNIKSELTAEPGMLNILEMFIFSCLTGLRISDVLQLKNENFKVDQEKVYMTIRMVKTVSIIKNFPIVKVAQVLNARDIINEIFTKRYNPAEPKALFFSKQSEPYINRVLKQIKNLANIDIPLTFHVARHTFGSLLAEKTGNVILIKELMGHTKVETSMIYIHMSQKRIDDTLDRFL